jgi:hypothetical protein
MPRFWLTQHYPHPDEPEDDVPWHVFFKQHFKAMGEQLSPGDKVLFYETKSKKPRVKRLRSGATKIVAVRPGRGGVVCAAEVSGRIRLRPLEDSQTDYPDGSHINWAWEVPCGKHVSGNLVPLETVLKTLKRGNIRILGGLLELSPDEYEQLYDGLTKG